MPMVDLVDETFVVASPAELAARLHDPVLWRRWWPELELTVFQDRGERGLRWTVTGRLVGSNEVWLEPWGDGVLVHYYLRADLTEPASATRVRRGSPGRLTRLARAETRRHATQVSRCLNALKDEVERGREPGAPRRLSEVPTEIPTEITTGLRTEIPAEIPTGLRTEGTPDVRDESAAQRYSPTAQVPTTRR